jgi:hypothetical protein
LDNRLWSLKTRLLLFGVIFVVLAIYSYPAIKTTGTTGSRVLPPISAPDLSLYLNISKVLAAHSAEILDPYYGVAVPATRLGYLKFRLAFLLFGQLTALLHGNLWLTLFLWNLLWWGLLCALTVWFFHEFLPDRTPELVLAGLALLMFLNFGVLKVQLAAWTRLPSVTAFEKVELPYIRPFFPQIPIPLLLLYLGLQIKALQKRRRWFWVVMGIIQLLAFGSFPYAMLMMAGITAVAMLGLLLSGSITGLWRTLSIYAIACAGADLLFFLRGGGVARTGAPGQYSLLHLQLSLLVHRIGGMWLLLAALTAVVFVIRDSVPEVRWALAGLGLSNLFLLSGDTFFSETALQVSHHGGYFVQLTTAVLFTFALSAGFRYLARRKATWRWALVIATALLLLNGVLVARATYRSFLPLNQEQAELTRFLHSDPPQADDLVIARADTVDDACAWVPLVSRARVLFCRSAQVLLSPEQNQQVQRFRQALYLYFTNKDVPWVEQVLGDPSAMKELSRLTFVGQVTTNLAERERSIEAVRTELIPFLARAEQKDPAMRSFFSHYRRVVVIDTLTNPDFSMTQLGTYLKIEKQEVSGSLLILICSPQ